jgi:hypothetical protein
MKVVHLFYFLLGLNGNVDIMEKYCIDLAQATNQAVIIDKGKSVLDYLIIFFADFKFIVS